MPVMSHQNGHVVPPETAASVGAIESDRPAKRIRTPMQARSRQSVEAIVSAAASVLEERGLPGFNTKVVAARAGVNVATLYQYFENKQAILTELARRADRQRSTFLRSVFDGADSAGEWEPLVRRAVDGLVELRRSSPAVGALRHALEADPELHDLHRRTMRSNAAAIQKILLSRRPDLDSERARSIGTLFSTVTIATVDLAFESEEVDRSLIDELVKMLIVHLRQVLEPSGVSAG